MTGHQLATTLALVATLVAQAMLPGWRLLVVTTGALASMVLSAVLGGVGAQALFAQVPWDVLVIVVVLGLFSEFLAASRAFGLLAVRAANLSGGRPLRLTVIFVVSMYAVSGVVNNLTALLLVLPVLLSLLKLLGTSQRHLTWTLGAVLVACNLGGAATPIGDFPAILLLGRGAMTFTDYLTRALPQTLVALGLFLGVVFVARPQRDLPQSPVNASLALTTMRALYRNVRVDRRLVVPGALGLLAMLAGWLLLPASWGLGPDVVAWAGAALVLWSLPSLGESLTRRRVDVEAVLFLLSLFLLVGAVRAAGTFELAGQALASLPLSPKGQVLVFLVIAAVLTGLFSAGPGMAALLDVAQGLAQHHPPEAIYVGLAMSVCAGSSLFLTAATSGPLTQSLTERAALRTRSDAPGRFGFFEFAPVGLLGFIVILGTGLAFVWASL
ncbi:MAG: permease [Myxococcaceae bacterium]|nr:permease [Myxococcaceae bacterium]